MIDRKKKYYFDILSAITSIEEFINGVNSFTKYTKDRKTKSAVERQLAIIGEAVKKIKDIDPKELIKSHSSIIGFRNVLVHAYDSVDDGSVWSIVTKHLPSLKQEVTDKLKT